jgi:hypothetical protein
MAWQREQFSLTSTSPLSARPFSTAKAEALATTRAMLAAIANLTALKPACAKLRDGTSASPLM